MTDPERRVLVELCRAAAPFARLWRRTYGNAPDDAYEVIQNQRLTAGMSRELREAVERAERLTGVPVLPGEEI